MTEHDILLSVGKYVILIPTTLLAEKPVVEECLRVSLKTTSGIEKHINKT